MTEDHRIPDDPRADRGLWDIVAAVPVPAAADGFMQRLSAKLAIEPHVVAQAAASGAAALPGPRAAARRRFPTRFLVAAATVAAAAAILVFAVPALRGTDTATAADMLASMSSSAGGVQAVRLHIVDGYVADQKTPPPPGPLDQHLPKLRGKTVTDLALDVGGNYRASQTVAYPGLSRMVGDFGYDETHHELRVASASSGDGVVVLRPAWHTDFPNIDVFYLAWQADANVVRALLAADPEMPVTEASYLGRPVWQATFGIDYRMGAETVVVDKETGLLLAVDRYWPTETGDHLISCMRVTRMEVDPALPAGWQMVPLLNKTTAELRWNYFQDEGTRFGGPGSVATRSSPTPVVLPTQVPAGYRRAAVATMVYEDSRPGHEYDNSWHYSNDLVRRPQGQTPGIGISKRLALRRCAHLVRTLFRRGFDTFTITVTPRSGQRPLEQVTAGRKGSHDVVLSGGLLSGVTARVWVESLTFTTQTNGGRINEEPSQGPVLVAYTDRWRVVISGALTGQELVGVANSLQVHGYVDKPLPAGGTD